MMLWSIRELQALRRTLFTRAGRLTGPDGGLTLTAVPTRTDIKPESLQQLHAR